MNIITGTTGTPHVTSQQQREINMAIFGKKDVVLNIGGQFAATVGSNSVTVSDGCLSMQGCCASIPAGAVEEVTIENGSQGTSRIDIICAIYTNSGGIENAELGVVKGAASSAPSAPVIPEYEIREGAVSAYMPLYKVKIENTSITGIEKLFKIFGEQKLLWSGKYLMMGNQTVNLSEPVSEQREGLELVFAPYNVSNDTVSNTNRICCRISKSAIFSSSDSSFIFNLNGTSNFASDRFSAKTLKFTDTAITGSDHNTLSGTASSGIKYDNNGFVLVAVYGV